jgi:hypothetical protein
MVLESNDYCVIIPQKVVNLRCKSRLYSATTSGNWSCVRVCVCVCVCVCVYVLVCVPPSTLRATNPATAPPHSYTPVMVLVSNSIGARE